MLESTYLPREARARLAHFDEMLFSPPSDYITISDLQVLWRTMFPEPMVCRGRGLIVTKSVIRLRLDSHRLAFPLYGFEVVQRLTKAKASTIRVAISMNKTTPRSLMMFWPPDIPLPESCVGIQPRFALEQTSEPVLEGHNWIDQAKVILTAMGCEERDANRWLSRAAARKLK
ncbi:MAG: hypothetical protein PHU06_06000 [Gallionella sp.]|nr:hypothetical protein [Gallionella sp.]MDD4958408.1 hypothetical protein [Gallionella sp.]